MELSHLFFDLAIRRELQQPTFHCLDPLSATTMGSGTSKPVEKTDHVFKRYVHFHPQQ